jgi:hypothetical protein
VPRLPTALLSVGVAILGGILFTCGIVLDAVTHGRKETKRMAYLSVPAPTFEDCPAFIRAAVNGESESVAGPGAV